MKIAVYTIAKNEEQFIQRWYKSAKDADYLFILDTGSTDNTVELAKSLGINTEIFIINPWRFDTARNKALSLLPENIDICIALDMDEILIPGWREKLELINDNTTRPRYKYIWNWNEDGTPGLTYGGDKIHKRHNYIWKHQVHEVLNCQDEEVQEWIDLEIHHHADNTKSRSQYFPLLELAVQEDPDDDRNAYYLAREYYFYNKKDQAIKEFKRHLSLPKAVWKPERAASMRYLSKLEIEKTEHWLIMATNECPDRREGWVDLAQYYYEKELWQQCYDSVKHALSITEKPLEYLCEEFAWGSLPYDLGAIAAYNLEMFNDAVKLGFKACMINKNDIRLENNLVHYINKI